MSEALRVVARMNIHPGKLDDFKSCSRACIESVRTKDTGTLRYDWYLTEDESQCVVLEHYQSSEAVLEHIGNLGELFGDLLETCEIRIEVFGNQSQELIDATAAFKPKAHMPFLTQ